MRKADVDSIRALTDFSVRDGIDCTFVYYRHQTLLSLKIAVSQAANATDRGDGDH